VSGISQRNYKPRQERLVLKRISAGIRLFIKRSVARFVWWCTFNMWNITTQIIISVSTSRKRDILQKI